jgi:hypothetical protein
MVVVDTIMPSEFDDSSIGFLSVPYIEIRGTILVDIFFPPIVALLQCHHEDHDV